MVQEGRPISDGQDFPTKLTIFHESVRLKHSKSPSVAPHRLEDTEHILPLRVVKLLDKNWKALTSKLNSRKSEFRNILKSIGPLISFPKRVLAAWRKIVSA